MGLSDDELLDFDHDRIALGDSLDFRRLLTEHGDLYRNHLAIAKWIDGWCDRRSEPRISATNDDYEDGFEKGIREIAAHLRQGDFLADGALLDEV